MFTVRYEFKFSKYHSMRFLRLRNSIQLKHTININYLILYQNNLERDLIERVQKRFFKYLAY